MRYVCGKEGDRTLNMHSHENGHTHSITQFVVGLLQCIELDVQTMFVILLAATHIQQGRAFGRVRQTHTHAFMHTHIHTYARSYI
jgi:hypothetical protein